jgi:2-keto-3-deoxy-L-rhamnonate aldolase RhmA
MDKNFRKLMEHGEEAFGIFVKTASHQIIEIVGHCNLDFVVIDAEHAPFSRGDLDVCLLAARSNGLPALVRVPELTEAAILAPLDLGAAGVMVPRIQNAAQAARAVRAAKYAGERGFSNSPRAAQYGVRSIAHHLEASDNAVAVIAMIEDEVGIDNLHEIAAVDGIDALFIGRVDLTVSLGQNDVAHPIVEAAVQRIIRAKPLLSKPLGALAPKVEMCAALRRDGIRMFLLGTDQGILRTAVTEMAAQAKQAQPSTLGLG